MKDLKIKKCLLEISKILVNHKSNDIEVNHYIKLKLKDKRDLYDTYFPYSDFPWF